MFDQFRYKNTFIHLFVCFVDEQNLSCFVVIFSYLTHGKKQELMNRNSYLIILYLRFLNFLLYSYKPTYYNAYRIV